MLADTNAIITLQGIYLTDDGQIAEPFTLELEIVASHDPNRMSVSNTRMGFRGVRRKQLTYKVQFQNTGEGPASKVELTCIVPDGLNPEKLEIVDQYPACPICPEGEVSYSCLDTTLLDEEIIFTFRNIYLPGTRQDGVKDRDSTKGFVKYRLKTGRGIKKKAMASRASIVFDKNEPIVTNSPHTRFKPGLSPGLIISRNIIPGQSDAAYYSLGASVSPFKPYRKYLQSELYLGLNRQSELSQEPQTTTFTEIRDIPSPTNPFPAVVDSTVRLEESQTIDTYSIELVPASLRYNLTDFVGIGTGAIVQLDASKIVTNSVRQIQTLVYRCPELNPNIPRSECEPNRDLSTFSRLEDSSESNENTFRFKLFADVQLGMVRRGPLLGIRGILPLGEDEDPYYSVYLCFRL